MYRIVQGCIVVLMLAVSLVVAPTPASAATITVGNGCTLADAIIAANTDTATGGCTAGSGADTIVLEAGATYTLTAVIDTNGFAGLTGLPVTTSNVTIEGNGATIERDPNAPRFRLLRQNGGDLTLRNMTFRGGNVVNGSGSLGSHGGCLYTEFGSLRIDGVTIAGCSAAGSGALLARYQLVTIVDSTFTDNTALEVMRLDYETTTTIENSTFNGNFVADSIAVTESSASLTVTNSTIIDGWRASLAADLSGTISARNSMLIPAPVELQAGTYIDLGNNITSGEPKLGDLADNGGPTMTLLPLPGSPAFDAANSDYCPNTDQRGITRSQGAGCEIGAVEVEPSAPVLSLPTLAPVEATAPSGAQVIYTASAVDYTGKPVGVVCNPASGSTFPLGPTTVSCTATDALNQQTTGTFQITVQDTIAPVTTATAATYPGGVAYASGDWTNQDIAVSFNATDSGSGVDHIEVVVTNAGGVSGGDAYTDSIQLLVDFEGVSTLTYRSVDEAGNAETAKTFVVMIDKTAPVTTVTALTNPVGAPYSSDTWTNQSVDLTFTTADGTGSGVDQLAVSRSLDGGTPTPVTLGNGGILSIVDEGTTTVTYHATDAAGNQEVLQTFVVKIDKSAPSITAPANITVNATSPDGAFVTYPAPVVSDNLTTVVTSCDPASGSQFPVGTTTVTCTATDEVGNAASDTFTVTVIGAGALLDDLYTLVQQVPISGDTSSATSVRRNMLSMVALADAFEAAGADSASCLMLTRLELEVRTQTSKRRINARDAQILYAKIDEAQAAIGCGVGLR